MAARRPTQTDSADTAPVAGEGDDPLMMTYRTNIAANIKRLRAHYGIRQKDLAKMMGTAQGHLASIEMSKVSIGLHTLSRLADALKVEASTLLHPAEVKTEARQLTVSERLQDEATASATVAPGGKAPRGKLKPAPEMLIGQLAVGVSLTTVKEIVGATHKRLEALERRHGPVPMTREMLTSVLVALLNASQNIDKDGSETG